MPVRPLLFAFVFAVAHPVAAQDYVPNHERAPDFAYESGTEITLLYFGGSNCFACHDSTFKRAMEQAKGMLAERAEQNEKAFSVVGVALDLDVEKGLAFLHESGGFDEISTGRNWFNTFSLDHLWSPERPADQMPGLPSVVVIERDVTLGTSGIAATAPRHLVQLTGGTAIVEWIDAGAPLE